MTGWGSCWAQLGWDPLARPLLVYEARSPGWLRRQAGLWT